jgi:hypothetical protein
MKDVAATSCTFGRPPPPPFQAAIAKTDLSGDGASAAPDGRKPPNRSGFKTTPVG